MNPVDVALKIASALFDLGARAMEAAAKGDAEALASLEADDLALGEFLAAKEAREKTWRAANDERIEALRRRQEAPAPLPGVDARPAPVDAAIDDDEILK